MSEITEVLQKILAPIVKEEVAHQIGDVIKNLPEPQEDIRWMTAKDFCQHYNVSRSTLQRMERQERVDVLDGGNRIKRFRWKGEAKK